MSDQLKSRSEVDLDDVLAKRRIEYLPGRGGGDGGGSMDDVIRRIASLEDGHQLIIGKLDGIATAIQTGNSDRAKHAAVVEGDLKVLNTKLDAKATSADLNKVGGDLALKVQSVEKDLATRASATELAGLKGGVEKLPTSLSLFLSLGGFIVAVFVAAGVAKHFGW